jgi:hypothetical protein
LQDRAPLGDFNRFRRGVAVDTEWLRGGLEFHDLADCFNYGQPPLAFKTIKATLSARDFLEDKIPATPPDDDKTGLTAWGAAVTITQRSLNIIG